MAAITLNIPDNQITRVVEALCEGNNPTNAKAKEALIDRIKWMVVNYEVEKARLANLASLKQAQADFQTAQDTASTNANTITIS